MISTSIVESQGLNVHGDKDETVSNFRGAVARMDAARGSILVPAYNSAVEKLRETEYPMLNGMPPESHRHL